jgi:hypothetical protein
MKANGYKTTPWTKGKRMSAVEKELRLANYDVTIPHPNDDFFEAVFNAIEGFRGAELRAACVDGGPTADLILWLLSERPLSPGDRRSLANLLTGELHSTGRPRSNARADRQDAELIADARRWKAANRKAGMTTIDAEWNAAKQAAKDPRARKRSVETLRRAMQSKSR